MPAALIASFLFLFVSCGRQNNQWGSGSPESRSSNGRAVTSLPAAVLPGRTTVLPVAPARSPSKPVPSRFAAECGKICDRSRELKCPHSDQCLAGCLSVASFLQCSDAFAALYTCLSLEPLNHWECADDGVAAIRDGFCEPEQAAASGCLEQNLRKRNVGK